MVDRAGCMVDVTCMVDRAGCMVDVTYMVDRAGCMVDVTCMVDRACPHLTPCSRQDVKILLLTNWLTRRHITGK